MEWDRGEEIGCGSFATISLAVPRKASSAEIPSLMAVKSSEVCNSASIKNEKEVLGQLENCPQVIRCFGENYSVEKGEELYNLMLEYASGGSLVDQLKKNGGRLPESDVRKYTKTVLKGLSFVHARGFVHCDIKLQNILVFQDGAAKIADFGLAKKTGEEKTNMELRGTPLYMAPESVNDNEYEPASDIWSLGCAVAEMVTGKPAWNCKPGSHICSLLIRIGVGDELPEIPEDLSEEGKDFLRKCFVKDPRKRWTSEMLLNHPFVADDTVLLEEVSPSPRGPFDFPDWVSMQSTVEFSKQPDFSPGLESANWLGGESNSCFGSSSSSCSTCLPIIENRLRQLATDETPNWSFSDSWFTVR